MNITLLQSLVTVVTQGVFKLIRIDVDPFGYVTVVTTSGNPS